MEDRIWRKRFLVPLWVAQILICIVLIGLSAVAIWAFGEAASDGDFGNDASDIVSAFDIAAAVSLALSLLTIILDVIEVMLYVRGMLKPVCNIVMQCIKSAIWMVWFILTVAGAAEGSASGLGIFLALVLFLATVAQLVYSSIILHRYRKGKHAKGSYSLAEGGKMNAQPYTAVHEPASFTAYRPTSIAPSASDPFGDPAPPFKPAGSEVDYYGSGGVYELHNGQQRYQ